MIVEVREASTRGADSGLLSGTGFGAAGAASAFSSDLAGVAAEAFLFHEDKKKNVMVHT